MKVEPKLSAMCQPVCEAEVEKSWPCVYFSDLPPNVLKGLEVGSEVSVIIKGRVKAMTSRQSYDDKDEVCSNLDVEYNDIVVKKGGKNEWEELA